MTDMIEGHVGLTDELTWHGNELDDRERMEALCSKAIYKGTSCGAWISFTDTGVTCGSIVEGADECTQVHELTFPFKMAELWKALTDIEQEADVIWKRTHGCEKCWPMGTCDEWGNEWKPGEVGNKPVDPDCPECKGEGVVV